MVAEIKVSTAKGTVLAPPSKSMAHRLLICAALSQGVSRIYNIARSQDILATIDCLTSLGAKFTFCDDYIAVKGLDLTKIKGPIKANCRESGSTLRFIIPLMLLTEVECALSGSEYLFTRPLSIYEEIANYYNFKFLKNKNGIELKGILKSGTYEIPGNISSQFISGLLFALPLLENDSLIKIKGILESRPYVDLTIDALKQFDVTAEFLNDNEIFIKGTQKYRATDTSVEGDYSNAAFYEALNFLGSGISVNGLKKDSYQGDKVYFEYFNQLKNGTPTLDITDCPDLAPILFTIAAYFNGGVFTGTKRLKMKESDRAQAMKTELQKFGADIVVLENEVIVKKSELHKPNEILNGHNDHRIVMSLCVLLSRFGGKINNAEAVSKSFPDFFENISFLGIGVNILAD